MADKDRRLVSMAQQFSGLPMKSLIGAPLIAAAEANSMMAMNQTRFILNTGFELDESGESPTYKPIMINMTLSRQVVTAGGEPAESVETNFCLPLLTIIPISSLAVDEVNVYFEMEVVSSFSTEKNDKDESNEGVQSSIDKRLKSDGCTAELTGSVTASQKTSSSENSKFEKSNSAKYEITAHAMQIPLPKGITTILEAFTQSIAPIQDK